MNVMIHTLILSAIIAASPVEAGAAGTVNGIPRLGIPRLGIPRICLADGPAGLRISERREGDVVQIYVKAPHRKLDKPSIELKGFAKTPMIASSDAQHSECSRRVRICEEEVRRVENLFAADPLFL